MTKDEAIRLALETLEEIADEVFSAYDNKLGAAILALREALAEDDSVVFGIDRAPAQRKPLTDDEIAELHYEIKVRLMGTYKTEDIYRAIEAKLWGKNT